MAIFGHPRERLRYLRERLGLSQSVMAQAIGTRQGSVSDWETGKTPVDRGWLRLASDLCANDREVFRWLVDGGEVPQFLSILSGASAEQAWQGERREVARRLRILAEELDPPVTPPRTDAGDAVAAVERLSQVRPGRRAPRTG